MDKSTKYYTDNHRAMNIQYSTINIDILYLNTLTYFKEFKMIPLYEYIHNN